MTDMTEGCEHCDAAAGEPCDPVASPHQRHATCTMTCAWKQREASERKLPPIRLEGPPYLVVGEDYRPRSVVILSAERPESDAHAFPSYHELLDHLCSELGVPGSPSFWEAVAHVKRRLGKGTE